MIGPWLPCWKPNAGTSGKSAKNVIRCTLQSSLRSYPWLSGTNRSATRPLPTAFSTVSYITLIAWSYAVSPYAKQKLSAPNPKPTILLLPDRSSRNSAAGDKGAQTPPLPPAPPNTALRNTLAFSQPPILLPNTPSQASALPLNSQL